jgi:hypothetical protein
MSQRVRNKIIIAAVLTACLTVFNQQTSEAAPLLGIADQHGAGYQTELFRDLAVKQVRLTVPFDSALKKGFARDDIDAAMDKIKKSELEVLVVIARSRTRGVSVSKTSYRRGLKAVLKRWPQIHLLSPYNEANLTAPTKTRPAMAAAFSKISRQLCRSCLVASPSVVDVGNLASWSRKYSKALPRKYRPSVWLLHNYMDANYLRISNTKVFMREHRKNTIWIAETGGLFSHNIPGNNASRWDTGAQQQVKVFNWLTKTFAKKYKNVSRIYIYQWSGSLDWDSGIVDASGNPRPIYFDLLKYQQR